MKRTFITLFALLLGFVCSAQQFVYFTDAHVEKNESSTTADVLNKILTDNPVKTVIFGGDGTMSGDDCRTKSDIDASWRRFDYITEVVKNHKGSFYLVRGNHDLTTGTSDTNAAGFTYSQQNAYSMLKDRMVNAKVKELGNNSLNYFFDDKKSLIRFIVLDPYSSAGKNLEKKHGVAMDNTTAAADFLASSLKSMRGSYKAVVVMHQGMNQCTDIGNIVNANSAKVVMVIHGHVHKDFETFENGVLHVATTSSNCHKVKASLFGDEDRTFNSKTETAIDIVNLDLQKGRIEMKRMGGGYSRYVNLKPIFVAPDQIIHIKSSLKKITDWKMYDVDGTVRTHADFATNLRHGGQTIKGIDEGELVLIAYNNQTRERELFHIICKEK